MGKTSIVLSFLLATMLGVAIGWVARAPAKSGSGDRTAEKVVAEGSQRRSTASRSRRSDTINADRWMPENERAFMHPKTEAEHAEVQRLTRAGLEKELVFYRRIKAIADLLAMMTPENAHDIRDAFENSKKDGYDYGTERGVFLSRYAEVMGREAAEQYKNDPSLKSLVVSWALTAPAEAVAWVNELPPGSQRDAVINRLIGQMGPSDPSYAMSIFESLDPRDQALNQRAIVEAYLRSGGREACAGLAQDLLARDDASLRKAGLHALQRTFDLFHAPEELSAWLQSLPPDQLVLLDQSKLPDEFRSTPPAP